MLTLLAQSELPANVPAAPADEQVARDAANSAASLFNGNGEIRIEQWFWDHATGLNYVAAGLIIAAGLVYLLYGYKIFKVLVIVNAALLGATGAHWIDQQFDQVDWWVIPVGAAALALIAWPLMRFAVCVMGGLAGAVLGAFVWRSFQLPDNMLWAGSAIGLVALGLLAFIIFRIIIIGFTSLQGALMAVAGSVALAARWEQVSDEVRDGILNQPWMLPVVVLLPALIGFVYQCSRGEKKDED